ncbi:MULTISPECIES: DUF6243 family protein [unclassified Streptomyces]|uniref:DUF6243 family protein n=1 Tax=unclassified Streptomyces TaxID=2593676 RepID=UPI00225A35EF|nr:MULTISPECIES: DUF6243 family protein [unclassified Streptomyces]MCX5140142.1 DUF6243 family protein [Streptomyces sp. NBC_00338]WRZ64737.1 DUF6243 family protein [Streptomyces sp. NBC_01257]
MAKSRNNLLGVGGQRRKLTRAEQQGAPAGRDTDRKSAAEQKQELLRKMRERATGTEASDAADAADATAAPEQDAPAQS